MVHESEAVVSDDNWGVAVVEKVLAAVAGDVQYVVVIASVAFADDDSGGLVALFVEYSFAVPLGSASSGHHLAGVVVVVVVVGGVAAAFAGLLHAVDLAAGAQIALDNNYYSPLLCSSSIILCIIQIVSVNYDLFQQYGISRTVPTLESALL